MGGVRVTSDNCNNITGSNITSGTAVFTPSNNTLTLTNVTITRTGSDNRAIQSDRSGLIVKLVGTNKLSAASASVIRFNQPGSIVVSSGTTTVTGGTEGGVYSNNVAVTVSGPGKLVVKSTDDKYGFEGKGSSSSSTLTFSNVTVEASGKKGALYDWSRVTVNASSHLTLKATGNSSYPVAYNLGAMTFNGNESIVSPPRASYNSSSKGITLSGNLIYSSDIIITDDCALLINSVNFPDTNFRNYMLQNFPKGYMTASELNGFTDLYVQSRGIYSLQGVELLPALKVISCENNELTTLNLSACTNLVAINCSNNKFQRLEITGLPNLSSLTVKNNQYLTELNCQNNALSVLMLEGCTSLASLHCSNNYLATFDLSDCSRLKTIYADNNTLRQLDVSPCTLLETLSLSGNYFSSLSINGMTKLTRLVLTGNQSLLTLNCYNNALTSIGLQDCINLRSLDCHGNALAILTLTDCSVLQSLDIRNNQFTSLSVSNRPLLTTLKVAGNALMTTLNCNNCGLTALDLTGCTRLKEIRCQNNQLTSLDVSYCTQLELLNCYSNSITLAGMNTLVGSLPNRSSTAAGKLYALYGDNDQNVMNIAHITSARARNWIPYKYINSQWTELQAFIPGDVDGDGIISISDVTELIDLLLTGGTPSPGADVDGDGNISISDVTELIDWLLTDH